MPVSASQIESLDTCERLFGGRYLCGFPYEKNEAASLGSETHEVAELYHKHGKRPDRTTLAGRLFLLALPHAPLPGVGRSEGKFSLRVGGITYSGIIDHINGNEVTDYKTTGALKKAALDTKEKFLKNPQALIYAVKTLVSSGALEVKLTWIYLEHKKNKDGEKEAKQAKAFSFILTKAEVEAAFGPVVHDKAERLVELKKKKVDRDTPEAEKKKKFFSLTPNFESCYKFGRCQFYDLCHNEDSGEEINMQSLAEKLKAGLAQSKGINAPESKGEVATAKPAPAPKEETKPAADKADEPKPVAITDLADAELGRAVRLLFTALRG